MIRKLIRFAVRVAKFGIVGVVCTLLQLVILKLLNPFMPAFLASLLGFLISAQLNFLLSYSFTWRDSERKKGRQLVATWLRFNGVVLIGATINTVAFALFNLALDDWLAVFSATVISTSCTFFLNHFHVLRPERQSGINDTTIRRSVPARME